MISTFSTSPAFYKLNAIPNLIYFLFQERRSFFFVFFEYIESASWRNSVYSEKTLLELIQAKNSAALV